MRVIFKKAVFFVIGAVGYAAVELLYRGRTHWSMMLAGGVCFVIFSVICERLPTWPLVCRAVVASLAVTAVELVFGVIFNIALGMGVWDYSGQPCNLLGQICPLFSFAWCGIALLTLPLAEALNRRL